MASHRYFRLALFLLSSLSRFFFNSTSFALRLLLERFSFHLLSLALPPGELQPALLFFFTLALPARDFLLDSRSNHVGGREAGR